MCPPMQLLPMYKILAHSKLSRHFPAAQNTLTAKVINELEPNHHLILSNHLTQESLKFFRTINSSHPFKPSSLINTSQWEIFGPLALPFLIPPFFSLSSKKFLEK